MSGESTTAIAAVPDSEPRPGKAPAFQFYPKDFISDTVEMSAEEVGVYIRLICRCWSGPLSDDLEILARIGGVPVGRLRRLWQTLGLRFRPDPNNPGYGLIHPRVERERRKQVEFRRRASDHGKRGGRPKKDHESKTVAFPNPLPNPKGNESSAICSLHSVEREEKRPSLSGKVTNDELGDRAGAFIEWYAGIYPTLLKGTPYRRQDALDFPTACSLCATWPDDRLRLMAEIFLRTDHKFAAEGRRSIRQFAGLAEWCDTRLRENGR